MKPTHPLHLLGAALAVHPLSPDRAAALTAADLDWPGVLRLAGRYLVTPSVADACRRQGLFDRLPAEVRDYLDGMRDLNRQRNRVLLATLVDLARALNPIGVQPLLLKGANTLLPGQYPGAADRVIGDLDLGVPTARLHAAESLLYDLGYRTAPVTPVGLAATEPLLPWERPPGAGRRLHLHRPPLLHPTLPVKVELHGRLVREVPDDLWLQAELTTQAHTLAAGAVVWVPDPGTRLLHTFLHGQITDGQRRLRRLNLRQLLDFAALARQHPEVLTPALVRRLRPRRRRAWLEYVAQAEHWLGLDYPPTLPRAWSARREIWLQERVATRPGCWRLFAPLGRSAGLAYQLGVLPLRLVLTPGWFPWRWRLMRERKGHRAAPPADAGRLTAATAPADR